LFRGQLVFLEKTLEAVRNLKGSPRRRVWTMPNLASDFGVAAK